MPWSLRIKATVLSVHSLQARGRIVVMAFKKLKANQVLGKVPADRGRKFGVARVSG